VRVDIHPLDVNSSDIHRKSPSPFMGLIWYGRENASPARRSYLVLSLNAIDESMIDGHLVVNKVCGYDDNSRYLQSNLTLESNVSCHVMQPQPPQSAQQAWNDLKRKSVGGAMD